jgi:hypothetical protein
MPLRTSIPVGTVFPSADSPCPRLTTIAPPRLEFNESRGENMAKVLCVCTCGNTKDAWVDRLKSKKIRSCGCYQIQVRSENAGKLKEHQRKQAPKWMMGRLRTPTILACVEVLDDRPDDTRISQWDEIRVRCRTCGIGTRKPAVEIERHPSACARCSGKEQWTRGRLREAIAGKRELYDSTGTRPEEGSDEELIVLQNEYFFRCVNCGDVKKATAFAASRLKTASCKLCMERAQWTLGDFRAEVSKLGGEVLDLTNNDDSMLIYANQKLRVRCPFRHEALKTPQHVKEQQTLCLECSTLRSERIVRAYFEALFGTPFPRSTPEWLVNPATDYGMHIDGYSESLRLAFEHDGPQHHGVPFFSMTPEDISDLQQRDSIKNKLCQMNAVRLIRVSLHEIKPLEKLREVITQECAQLGVHVPHPHAPVDCIAITPEDIRLFDEVRVIVESRGGKILSTAYLGSAEPLEIDCGKGHIFWAAPHKLKDRQFRWCRECYRIRRRNEGAANNGGRTYYERVVSHLSEAGCTIATPDADDFDARSIVSWVCPCGIPRGPAAAASVLATKNNGLCRGCIAKKAKEDHAYMPSGQRLVVVPADHRLV